MFVVEVQITIDYNNVNLFDTKVDLLELIKPGNADLSSTQSQIASPVSDNIINSYIGETDALLHVSELLASDLQSLEYASPSKNITEQPSPDYSTIEYNATVLKVDDGSAEVDSILSGQDMDSILSSKEVDSILSNSVELLGAAPILSPVSTEDIDRVLQSEPTSPYSIESEDTSLENSLIESDPDLVTVDSSYLMEELLKPAPEVAVQPEISSRSMRPQRQKVRYDPYTPPDSPDSVGRSPYLKTKSKYEPSKVTDSKSRKKQQNKDAALRYRMKKKNEKSNIVDECSQLEKKNEELKDKVDCMTREIKYLKDLLLEVHQAKSGFKSQSHLIRSK